MDAKEKARILQKAARLVRFKRLLDEVLKELKSENMKGVKPRNE